MTFDLFYKLLGFNPDLITLYAFFGDRKIELGSYACDSYVWNSETVQQMKVKVIEIDRVNNTVELEVL